jgi:hypothetical protein
MLAPKAIGVGVAALAAVPAANAATFTVTNLNDAGAGSLRDAIVQANGAAGADVITFQAGLTGTITLTTGQLYIEDSVDIQGPGAANLTISGNSSSRVFYLYDSSATLDVRIADLTITDGADSVGGGIIDFDENLRLDGVTITNNHASGDGGGLWADGFNMTLTILNSTLSGNTADDDGGGIYVEDTGALLTISNSVISGNNATGAGGGIYFYDPDQDILITNTTISGNTAGTIGGGIYLYSFDNGGLTIQGSTISGNTAAAGGGLDLYGIDTSPLLIENTTISGNQVSEADGGGIELYNLYVNATFNFVTIANNTASGSGGGIAIENTSAGNATISSSIVADNTAASDADIAGPAFDIDHSLIEAPTTAAVTDNGGNLTGVDPQLGALANNGGSTETQRPAITSPVVNGGDPATTVANDQRGQPREYPTVADMGAVELIGGVIQFNPTTYNVAETGGSVTLTVVRDIGPDPASVNFTTNPGSATPGAGNDYTTTSGTVNFAAGDLSETFVVPILDDSAAEGNETFTATLNTPSGDASIGAIDTGTVTIVDDPTGTAQFSVSTLTTDEDAGTVTVTVTRVGGTEGPLTVNYATADGTATAPSDYTAAAGIVTFPAGDATPQTFNVTIVNDTLNEGDETFNVNLTGASVGAPNSLAITISQNDAVPVPALSWLGKMLLIMMTGIAGLYAVVRNRFTIMLFALMIAGIAVAPALSAAEVRGHARKGHAHKVHEKESKPGKVTGTLVSVTKTDSTIVLNLQGGTSVTLPAKSVTVIDARKARRARGTLQQVVAGANVVIKVRKDPATGEVTRSRIKLQP